MLFDKHKIFIAGLLLGVFLIYSVYLYSHLPVQEVTVTASQEKGKMLWQKYNCNACHQVYGLGGFLGPDLTNEYSLRGPEFINAFLLYGNTTMPNFHLSPDEIQALTDYMQAMDASGKADPRKFNKEYNGTITR